MIIGKCILSGLLALLIAAIVLPMSVCAYLTWTAHLGENEGIGFDPVSAARYPPAWIVAALVFGLGFYLQYRRLNARQRSPARS
jgi:hypothetical protein